LSANGNIVFNDFAFVVGSVGPTTDFNFTKNQVAYNHCAFLGPLVSGGAYNDCYLGDGAQGSFIASINAGVWLPNAPTDGTTGNIIFSSDTYVTGDSALNIGRGFYQFIEVLPVFGAGVQIQSVSGSFPGIFYQQGASISLFGLVWGNGNATVGLAMGPGTIMSLPLTILTLSGPISGIPTINGALGDLWFELNAIAITFARTWDNSIGAYTESGGAATRATTWANLTASIVGGGFNGSMYSPEAQSGIVVNS
jgi:hypothetical protein